MIDLNVLIGVLLALVGSVCLNIGKGLEKMKVRVFAQGWGMFKKPHNRDLGIWLLGMLMTFSFGVFQWIAMKFVDNPSLITAMSGFGLVVLIIFAVWIIGENITAKEFLGIGMIILSTVVMTLFQAQSKEEANFNLMALILGSLIPIGIFGLLSAYALKARRLHGFAFGGLSGACNAVPSMLMKVSWVVVGEEASVFAQLKYPYLYFALLGGIVATATSQIGFWRDRAIIVVPTFVSFNMIVPAVIEYFVFGVTLAAIQYVAMAGIIAGVIFLSMFTPEKVLAVEIEEKTALEVRLH